MVILTFLVVGGDGMRDRVKSKLKEPESDDGKTVVNFELYV